MYSDGEITQLATQLATDLHTARWLLISIVFHACILLTAGGAIIAFDIDDDDIDFIPLNPDYRDTLMFYDEQFRNHWQAELPSPLVMPDEAMKAPATSGFEGKQVFDLDVLNLEGDFADVVDFDLRVAADPCNCPGGSGNICSCGRAHCRCYAGESFAELAVADWKTFSPRRNGGCERGCYCDHSYHQCVRCGDCARRPRKAWLIVDQQTNKGGTNETYRSTRR